MAILIAIRRFLMSFSTELFQVREVLESNGYTVEWVNNNIVVNSKIINKNKFILFRDWHYYGTYKSIMKELKNINV